MSVKQDIKCYKNVDFSRILAKPNMQDEVRQSRYKHKTLMEGLSRDNSRAGTPAKNRDNEELNYSHTYIGANSETWGGERRAMDK